MCVFVCVYGVTVCMCVLYRQHLPELHVKRTVYHHRRNYTCPLDIFGLPFYYARILTPCRK